MLKKFVLCAFCFQVMLFATSPVSCKGSSPGGSLKNWDSYEYFYNNENFSIDFPCSPDISRSGSILEFNAENSSVFYNMYVVSHSQSPISHTKEIFDLYRSIVSSDDVNLVYEKEGVYQGYPYLDLYLTADFWWWEEHYKVRILLTHNNEYILEVYADTDDFEDLKEGKLKALVEKHHAHFTDSFSVENE